MKVPVVRGFETERDPAIYTNLQKDFPYTGNINFNTTCNLRCLFCFTSAGLRSEGQLSLEEYFDVIDQMAEFDIKRIHVEGMGEPFLDPLLMPVLEYAMNKGIWAVVFTNMTLINDNLAGKLFNMPVSILGKWEGFDEETVDYLVGEKGGFRNMESGFKALINAGFNKTDPSRLCLDTVITKQNISQAAKFVRFCIENNIQPTVETMQWKGRAVENLEKLKVSSEEIRTLWNQMNKIPEIKELNFFGSYQDNERCSASRTMLTVNFNGDAHPCLGRNDIVLGNVRTGKLKDIWFSDEAKKYRMMEGEGGECPAKTHARKLYEKLQAK
ncbi:MAG: radical SAM protein [Firmicutes bacterium]|nr:radical SAM protein [Bacillota bacterium]